MWDYFVAILLILMFSLGYCFVAALGNFVALGTCRVILAL